MARERYLLNADEESIHNKEIKMTTSKQKIENWWFYNSRKLVAVIIILIFVIAFVVTVFTKVKPDYTIGIISNKNFGSDITKIMEEQLSSYGKDLNGDGKVVIEVTDCSIGNGNSESIDANTYAEIGVTQFMADMNNGSSIIWIHDEVGYAYTGNKVYPLFTQMFDTEDPYMIALNDVKAFADLNFDAYEDEYLTGDDIKSIFNTLNVSFRDATGTATGNNAKDAYYAECLELLDNFITGTKVN